MSLSHVAWFPLLVVAGCSTATLQADTKQGVARWNYLFVAHEECSGTFEVSDHDSTGPLDMWAGTCDATGQSYWCAVDRAAYKTLPDGERVNNAHEIRCRPFGSPGLRAARPAEWKVARDQARNLAIQETLRP